jgi:hypothetical protein
MKSFERSRRCLAVLPIAAVLAITGCGPGGPVVYPVKGSVVHKGKGPAKDLRGYNIQFQSTTEPGEMPGGRVEEDGTFILYTRVGGKTVPGAKAGTYRACLTPPILEGGGTAKLLIPSRYTKFETSNLQYDIQAAPNEITIEIERGTR